jgi:hypothetical protein
MSIYLERDQVTSYKSGKTSSLGLSPESEALLGEYRLIDGRVQLDKKWHFISNLPPPGVCPSCFDSGWTVATLLDAEGNLLVLECETVCVECVGPVGLEATRDLLPNTYKWVEYKSLKPVANIPVPVDVQKRLLTDIQTGEFDGHSVAFLGPTRTGKTVAASALLGRMVHLYVRAGFFEEWGHYRLPIYRINTDEWLDEYEGMEIL